MINDFLIIKMCIMKVKQYGIVRTLFVVSMFFLSCGISQAQEQAMVNIQPYRIAVGYDQTTSLIFPYPIKKVYWGSSAIIVQKVKDVENILQAKAAEKDFQPTNLSVVTADGRFYSFYVHYESQPAVLNIDFAGNGRVLLPGHPSNAWELEKESWQVLGMFPFLGLRRVQQELQLRLQGIFLSEKNMWFRLGLKNFAQVDFQPAYVRFFLRDRKRSKRTVLREMEIFPVYNPAYCLTRGQQESVWVFAFGPFTIPRHQRLVIQMGDESGARVIQLSVKNKTLFRARRLPSS
jgi:conjugative transposon TraN protein